MTYQRNGLIEGQDPGVPTSAPLEQDNQTETKKEKMIRVDGYQQVLEMLQIADPEFRNSLLKRLAAQDPALAESLRKELGS